MQKRPRLTIMAHSWLFIRYHDFFKALSSNHGLSSMIIHESWIFFDDHGMIFAMANPLIIDGKPGMPFQFGTNPVCEILFSLFPYLCTRTFVSRPFYEHFKFLKYFSYNFILESRKNRCSGKRIESLVFLVAKIMNSSFANRSRVKNRISSNLY